MPDCALTPLPERYSAPCTGKTPPGRTAKPTTLLDKLRPWDVYRLR